MQNKTNLCVIVLFLQRTINVKKTICSLLCKKVEDVTTFIENLSFFQFTCTVKYIIIFAQFVSSAQKL